MIKSILLFIMSEILRISGNNFDHLKDEVDHIENLIKHVTNDGIIEKYGNDAVLNPTDIEIDTVLVVDEPTYYVKSWHQVVGDEVESRMQAYVYSFRISLGPKDAYLITEDQRIYRLTTRETLFIYSLGDVALANAFFSTPPEDLPE